MRTGEEVRLHDYHVTLSMDSLLREGLELYTKQGDWSSLKALIISKPEITQPTSLKEQV